MRKLLIATKNPGKFQEIKSALDGLPFEFVSPIEVGETSDFDESGSSFEEIAAAKAKYYADRTNLWAVSDDSGLMIDTLSGEPGIKTRRWPGFEATDDELRQFILQKMEGVDGDDRTAKFVCVAAFAVPRGGAYTAQAVVKGLISTEPKGHPKPGLPVDPIFYYPPYKKTFAEVSSELKQLVGPRAQAFKKLKKKIEALLEHSKTDKIFKKKKQL